MEQCRHNPRSGIGWEVGHHPGQGPRTENSSACYSRKRRFTVGVSPLSSPSMSFSLSISSGVAFVAGFLVSGFLVAGFLVTGFLVAGFKFLVAGVLVSDFLVAGVLVSGFLVAGILVSGFLAAGVLVSGFLVAGFLMSPAPLALGLLSGFLLSDFLTLGFLRCTFGGVSSFSLSLSSCVTFKLTAGFFVASSSMLSYMAC